MLKFKFLCQTKAHHKCTQTSGLWVSITLDIWERSYDGVGGAAFKKDLPFVSKEFENFKICLLIDFLFDCILLNLWPWINWNIGTFCTLFRWFRWPYIQMNLNKMWIQRSRKLSKNSEEKLDTVDFEREDQNKKHSWIIMICSYLFQRL